MLLDGRGWSGTLPGIWAYQTEEEIGQVRPDGASDRDEPFEGHTQADMEASHWDALARTLRNRRQRRRFAPR